MIRTPPRSTRTDTLVPCTPRFRSMMIRPGNVIFGPAQFTAADSAMYALVLGHLGAQLMAVTSDMNLRFLTKALPGDVIGEATFLKLGRRLDRKSTRLNSSH